MLAIGSFGEIGDEPDPSEWVCNEVSTWRFLCDLDDNEPAFGEGDSTGGTSSNEGTIGETGDEALDLGVEGPLPDIIAAC